MDTLQAFAYWIVAGAGVVGCTYFWIRFRIPAALLVAIGSYLVFTSAVMREVLVRQYGDGPMFYYYGGLATGVLIVGILLFFGGCVWYLVWRRKATEGSDS